MFSRPVPQQVGQISPLTPGQMRLAFFFSHSLQRTLTGKPIPSYHRNMRRTDVYLKVELVVDEKETPERLASEICRVIARVYGVRKAEVSSIVEREN